MAHRIEDDTKELIEDIEKLDNVLQLENDIYDVDSDSDVVEDEDHLIVDLEYSDRSISSHGVSLISDVRKFETADLDQDVKLPIESPYHLEGTNKKKLAEQALFLNRMLQDTIINQISKIKELLNLNASKMADLDENTTDNKSLKLTSSSSFRAPFFRRGLSFPAPNEDVISKRQSKDYDIIVIESVKDPRLYFRKSSRNTLKSAVIEDWKQKLLAPLLSRMESELEKKQKCSDLIEELLSKINLNRDTIKSQEEFSDVAEIKKLEEKISDWEKKIEKKKEEWQHHKESIEQLEDDIRFKKQITDDEIFFQVDSSKIDWMKISKMNFSGNITWVDCQKAWENQVCPKLNTASWSIEEAKKLKQLVAKSETNEWEKIAAEMGEGRTAFQCFSYYQRNLNLDLKSRVWTKEEEEKLIKVAQIIKDGLGHYRWTQVASLMDCRSPHECMTKFAKINPRQNRGKWSKSEDKNLLAAYQMFGSAWARIAKYVGTRNSLQCRDRYCNCLAPSLNFQRFTYDDDVKLLKLYKEMGPVWAKMVPHFQGRTDHMLLARYNRLKKWKRKTEWFNKLSDRTRKLLLGKSLNVQERQILMNQTKEYYKNILGVDFADYKRQQQDREDKIDPDLIPSRPPLHFKYIKSASLENPRYLYHKERLHQKFAKYLPKSLQINDPAITNGCTPATQVPQDTCLSEENETNQPLQNAGDRKTRKVDWALNKMFLSESTFKVNELVKMASSFSRKKTSNAVDEELKNLLCTKIRRRSTKLGRARRYFVKDSRPDSTVQAELDDVRHTAPSILMKSLGTNASRLHNEARCKRLEFFESITNQKHFENDPEYRAETDDLVAAVDRLRKQTQSSETVKKINDLEMKLTAIRDIFCEKYEENESYLETHVISVSKDVNYLNTILKKQNSRESDNFHGSLCCSTVADCHHLSDSESSMAGPSLGVEKSLGKAGERGGAPIDFLQLGRARRRSSKSHKSCDSHSHDKSLKMWSDAEIVEEKKSLQQVEKLSLTNLSLLPPNYTTLRCWRELMIKEKDLRKKAERLCNLFNSKSTDYAYEMKCAAPASDEKIEDSPVTLGDNKCLDMVVSDNCDQASEVKVAEYGQGEESSSVNSVEDDDDCQLVSENRPYFIQPVESSDIISIHTRTEDLAPYCSKKNNAASCSSESSLPGSSCDVQATTLHCSSVEMSPLTLNVAVSDSEPTETVQACSHLFDQVPSNSKRIQHNRRPPDTTEGDALLYKIRQQQEYKNLLARFKSLFLWPALLSSIQPDHESSELSSKMTQLVQRIVEEFKQKHGSTSDVPENSQRLNPDDVPVKRKRGRPKLINKTAKRTKLVASGVVQPAAESRPSTSEPNTQDNIENNVSEMSGRKKYGRPKGSKNKIRSFACPERPKRNAAKASLQPKSEERKDTSKPLPQWWKDAMLAAMISKKALEKDGEQDVEVNIADDDDFQDKGHYSDDEWAVLSKQDICKNEDSE